MSGHTSPDMCGYSTFTPTCLSRLRATKGILVYSLLIVSDVNGAWYTYRMMTGKNFCWKYANIRRRWMHQLWELRIGGEYLKLYTILREFPDKFREFYWMNIKTSDYILDSVKDDLQGYSNFRRCTEAEEIFKVAFRYVRVIVVKDKNKLHMQNFQY